MIDAALIFRIKIIKNDVRNGEKSQRENTLC